MPRNSNVSIPANAWTQITANDITAITFQNLSGAEILIKGTVGANAPTDASGAIRYGSDLGERNASLADLFPGISGANRVYALCPLAGSVMVSHA